MWILPADLAGFHLELTAGPHLLPVHYGEADIDKLSWLLRAGLSGVKAEIRLDDATLESLAKRKVTAPDALVVVRIREAGRAIDEVTERVKSLGARCALIQFPELQETGYGWLEREVKAPLYRAIGVWLKQPGHPLSLFNLEALPVIEAAGLTTDPVELADLLERCLAHRIRYADIGCDEIAYRRSLLLSAGERLAERLAGLEEQALQAAVEIILSEGHAPDARERFVAGARALVKVGLASEVAGDLRVGPLPRSIHEREVLGTLESKLGKKAWSEESRRLLAERSRATGAELAARTLTQIGAVGGSVDVPLPLSELQSLASPIFPDDPAVADVFSLLSEVLTLPVSAVSLDPALQDRLAQALRSLEKSAESSDLRQREASRLLLGLVQLYAARGPDALRAQEDALSRIYAVLDGLNATWGEDLRLEVMFWNAACRVQMPRGREDLEVAAIALEKCLSAWKTATRRIIAHWWLGRIATYHEDHARAREHYEEALQLALIEGNVPNQAALQLVLAREALGEACFGEAEQRSAIAMALYADAGTGHEKALAKFVRSMVLFKLGRGAEAESLAHQALVIFRTVGDVLSESECELQLAAYLVQAGQWERAEAAAKAALTAAESANDKQTIAKALVLQALIDFARGDIDEGLSLSEMAREFYEETGIYPTLAQMVRNVVALLPEDLERRSLLSAQLRARRVSSGGKPG